MSRIILCDYDDTLVDTTGSRIPAIIEYCQAVHGVAVALDQVRETWGVPFDQMMHNLGCSGEIDRQDYIDRFAAKYPIRPFPETEQALEQMGRGATLGILTSLSRPVLEADLAALGWTQRFLFLFGQEDTSAHKPDPRVFDPVIAHVESIGFSRDAITYIGNAHSDAVAAIEAGLHFVGVARTPQDKRDFSELNVAFQPDLNGVGKVVTDTTFHS